jgi:hypothetical protein
LKPLPQDPVINDASLRWLLRSLAHGLADGLRQNKVAAALAFLTLLASTVLALSSQFDERPRYREFILPDLLRIEGRFLSTMRYADHAPKEEWRLFYFLTAHDQIKDILRTAKGSWPASASARRAHGDFIRYYEAANEEFAIIRTEMSMKPELDYLAAWKKRDAKLRPFRDNWERWVQ